MGQQNICPRVTSHVIQSHVNEDIIATDLFKPVLQQRITIEVQNFQPQFRRGHNNFQCAIFVKICNTEKISFIRLQINFSFQSSFSSFPYGYAHIINRKEDLQISILIYISHSHVPQILCSRADPQFVSIPVQNMYILSGEDHNIRVGIPVHISDYDLPNLAPNRNSPV